MRLRQLNDVEWKPIDDWPKYEVSNTGEVRNAVTKDHVAQWEHTGRGTTYLRVTLRDKGKRWNPRVHRLVASAFLERPPETTEVDHIDDNPFNNDVSNLEWVTGEENIRRRESSRIQEARYAPTSKHFTQWVKKQIASNAKFEVYQLDDLDDVRQAVDDLTYGLGKPDMHDSEEKYEYWGWHIQPNDEYSFAVYVNTSPELFVERVAQ